MYTETTQGLEEDLPFDGMDDVEFESYVGSLIT